MSAVLCARRRRRRGSAALAVLALLLLGLPVSASAEWADLGVLQGTATVGRSHDGAPCAQGSPDRNPTGAGLGIPVVHGPTDAHWRLASTVFSTVNGQGQLVACGWLGPFHGVGAACGMSNGVHGYGVLTYATPLKLGTAWLKYVNWVFTVGGTIPVDAEVWHEDKTGGTPIAQFSALLQAQGAGPCVTKDATSFTVAGVYTMAP